MFNYLFYLNEDEQCDADRVDQIIDEIKSRNLALAETLARFSSKFDYDRIMQLMKNR